MVRPHPNPDREALLDFVDRVHALLAALVAALDRPQVDPEDARAARQAWAELQPHFDRLHRWLERSPMAQKRLEDVGLTGKQLSFKMRGFNKAHREYSTSPEKPGVRRTVLEWANRILGSFKGIPGAEAIKEMKDALEGFFKWMDK